MILRRLELKHFGRFGEKTFEFRGGMNLVVGPNESGKSTLMEAVPTILFGTGSKEKFIPWGRKGSCHAALVLETKDRNLRVERDILTDEVNLIEQDDLYKVLYQFQGKASVHGPETEDSEYLDALNLYFGMREEQIFKASVFLGQGTLGPDTAGGLRTKVKTLLSGGVETDYDRVLTSLREDFFKITKTSPWRDAQEQEQEQELDRVRARMSELEQRWYQVHKAAREVEDLRSEIERLRNSILSDSEDYQEGEKYLAWVRKQWQLDEKHEVLRRDFKRVNRESQKVEDLEKKQKELREALIRTGLPREIPEDLPVILNEADEARRELVSLQSESAVLRDQLLRAEDTPWRQTFALTLGLALLGAGFSWWRPQWLTYALLGAGLLGALGWVFYFWRAGLQRAERGRIKGQAQVLERKREEAQAKLAGLDERFEAIGMSPSAVEIVKMQKNLTVARQLADQLHEVEGALGVFDNSGELISDREKLTREIADLDQRQEQDRPQRREGLMPPEDIPDAERKLDELGLSIQEHEQQVIELLKREAALQGDLLERKRIEEEGERLKEIELQLVRRRDVLRLGHDLLTESVEGFRNNYSLSFETEVGRNLSQMTAGRYNEVKVSADFSFALQDKNGEWRAVEHFSRATIDALYFSVRLALAQHISRGRNFPLLLDDPLVNQDRARQAETLKMLERISQDSQVILFTHDETVLKRAARERWHVINLEEARTAKAQQADARAEDENQLCLL